VAEAKECGKDAVPTTTARIVDKISLMTDWLVPLVQIGGTGAVIAFALFIMGKWLLDRITAALNSYVAAYAQETAKIDTRIEHLEKLAEEQARLTRTVEGIKDEIAAAAKSRDNRWEFRKSMYIGLITAMEQILSLLAASSNCVRNKLAIPADHTQNPLRAYQGILYRSQSCAPCRFRQSLATREVHSEQDQYDQ
jgi:hypothetical protein